MRSKLYLTKIFFILSTMVLTITYASADERISEEISSDYHVVPLKNALGDESYKEAIDSGKYKYVGNSKCRLCHRNFFIGRKKDPHDHAMDSLIASGYEKNDKCLGCHTTGHGTPTGFISLERTPRLSNVQCEGCHGPGNVHIQLIKKKQRGGFLAGTDKPKVIEKMCHSCHTQRWDKSYHDFEAAYDKYRNANPNSKKK